MKITFKIGEENKPVIEPINTDTLKNSLFREQYKYALKSINRYFASPVAGNQQNAGVYNEFADQTDFRNNIFAFLGDRGSGKTSCMLSVARFLNNPQNQMLDCYGLDEIKKRHFYTLKLIDPLFFDSTHNILSIIIAELYQKFLLERKSLGTRINQSKARELLAKFATAQRDLTYMMEKHSYQEDDLQELNMLSAGNNLKKDIADLIASFFECFDKRGYTLLLMIDDVDLNTKEADKMTEQIRKYFIQENIVILMSLKPEQLQQIKKLSYTNEYSPLLNEGKMDFSDIEEMADRYIVKFIPHDQRIYMPDFEFYASAPLVIRLEQRNISQNLSPEENESVHENYYSSIRQAVLELIFRKTRYLFYNTEKRTSYIVPRNLRELRQLISMLYEMKDYRDSSIPGENDYNKVLFKKYMFSNWAASHLSSEDRAYIQEILSNRDIALFNSAVLKILHEKYFKEIDSNKQLEHETRKLGNRYVYLKDEISDQDRELSYVFSDKNLSYNISIGDVLSIIDLIEKRALTLSDQHFLFLLKTIYSMRLYETYDLKTAPVISGLSTNTNEGRIIREVIKSEQFQNLSEYDKLVAGRYFNSTLCELLPKSYNEPSRTNRKIDVSKLNLLISHCVEYWDGVPQNDSTILPLDPRKIQLAEFFMLCVSRDFDTRNKTQSNFYDPSYRTRYKISYANKFTTNSRNAFFDVNSFIFNVTRIEECYKRFPRGGEFFRLVNQDTEGKSLLSQFKNNYAEYRPGTGMFDRHKWLSLSSLRNTEIIFDLYHKLSDAKENNKFSADDIDILAMFFADMGSYSINTYDRSEDGEDFYSISFPFAKTVSNFLKRLNDPETEGYRNIFSSIYSSKQLPHIINISSMLRRKRPEKVNLKATLIQKIKETYSEYKTDERLVANLEEVFSMYEDKMTKSEMQEALELLNNHLDDGESEEGN